MKKLGLVILSILMLLLVTGCDSKIEKEIKGVKGSISDTINYIKDHKTNLCYSVIEYDYPGRNTYSLSHTNVPCNTEVEKLLINK